MARKEYKEQKFQFLAAINDSAYGGVGILDPTIHDYEDTFADGYVKTVSFFYYGGVWQYGKVSTNRIMYGKPFWAHGEEVPYFTKRGIRYYLDCIQKVNF